MNEKLVVSMLKFFYYPFRYFGVAIFISILFYIVLHLLTANSISFNDQVFFAICIGLIVFSTNLLAYIKLIMSYKKKHSNVSLKKLSYSEFKNELSNYYLCKNSNKPN